MNMWAGVWANGLLVGYYAVGLGLAGLLFLAIHDTTGATWSTPIRRVPEAMAETLPFALVLLAVVLVARPELYSWTSEHHPATGAMAFKYFWLSRPFFLARAAIYGAIWIAFAFAMLRASRRVPSVGLSAGFLSAFGVTFTLASIDWVMSLEPLWYSTIFGVYNFAGLFLSGLAALILIALWLERTGPLRQVLTEDHRHDLGKLLFAFAVFWLYIWFSQYMLIWYTNIPEETVYFVRRTEGPWLLLFWANVVLNGIIPFALLLRRDAKGSRSVLGSAAVVVLAGRWVDLYLMIGPGALGPSARIGLWEVGLAAAGIGGFALLLSWILKKRYIVAAV